MRMIIIAACACASSYLFSFTFFFCETDKLTDANVEHGVNVCVRVNRTSVTARTSETHSILCQQTAPPTDVDYLVSIHFFVLHRRMLFALSLHRIATRINL